LEQICRSYLEKLDGALQQRAGAAEDYEWIMLEMYDQTVREKPGGGMKDYLSKNPLPNEDFVCQRIGEEARLILEDLKRPSLLASDQRFKRQLSVSLIGKVLARLRTGSARLTVRVLLGKEGLRAFDVGRFRLCGEVHQWMYDRHSLARLLSAAGFKNPTVQGAMDSSIADWAKVGLDVLPDGRVQKPDSLFMEATKPENTEERAT
jgi:hypothetical protein